MFGLDYRTMLARDIVNVLDNSEEPLSVEKIKKKIGRSNTITINDVCKNLKMLVEREYGEKDYSVRLVSEERGTYKLERHDTNLQSLYKAIFETDLSYLILMYTIQYRDFSTYDFCSKHHVSFSTVQRRTKMINEEIKTFQVRISCSSRIKIASDELMIRSFSYLFFWSMHREISNTLFFSDYEHYIDLANEVIRYLNKPFDPVKTRSIALWMKLFSIGISKKRRIVLDSSKERLIESLKITEKPFFLSSWEDKDWSFLIGVINVTGIYPFDLDFDATKIELLIEQSDLTAEKFIEVSKNFFSIESVSVDKVKRLIYRYQLLNAFIKPTTKKELKSITKHILSFKSIREINPLYWKNFVLFWKELKKELRRDERHTYLRYVCLMICLDVYPLMSFRPICKIHLSSDFDTLYEGMLKQVICSHFSQNFQIDFVEEFDKAQVILTTTPLEKKVYSEKQIHLLVHSQLTSTDLIRLRGILNSLCAS